MGVKLWMIMTIFGAVHGTVGPLPYGYTTCVKEATMLNHNIDRSYKSGKRLKMYGKTVTPNDMVFACIFLDERPQLEKAD